MSVPAPDKIEGGGQVDPSLRMPSATEGQLSPIDQIINKSAMPILENITQKAEKILQGSVTVGGIELLNLQKNLQTNQLIAEFKLSEKGIKEIKDKIENTSAIVEDKIMNKLTQRSNICMQALFISLGKKNCAINNEGSAEVILREMDENIKKESLNLMKEKDPQIRKNKEQEVIHTHLHLGIKNLNEKGVLTILGEKGENRKLNDREVDEVAKEAAEEIINEFDKLGLWITSEDQALLEEKTIIEVTLLSLNQLSTIDLKTEAGVKELVPIALQIIHLTQQSMNEMTMLKRMRERREEEKEIEKEEQQRKVIQVDIMRTEQRLEDKKKGIRNLETLISDINLNSMKIVVNFAEPSKPDRVLRGTPGAPIK